MLYTIRLRKLLLDTRLISRARGVRPSHAHRCAGRKPESFMKVSAGTAIHIHNSRLHSLKHHDCQTGNYCELNG